MMLAVCRGPLSVTAHSAILIELFAPRNLQDSIMLENYNARSGSKRKMSLWPNEKIIREAYLGLCTNKPEELLMFAMDVTRRNIIFKMPI